MAIKTPIFRYDLELVWKGNVMEVLWSTEQKDSALKHLAQVQLSLSRAARVAGKVYALRVYTVDQDTGRPVSDSSSSSSTTEQD